MDTTMKTWGRRLRGALLTAATALLVACGGGGGGGGGTTEPPASGIAQCDAPGFQTLLSATAPQPSPGGGGTPPAAGTGSVRLHYHRPDGVYAGWQLYVWNAPGEALGGWPGRDPAGTDTFGVYWDVPVTSTAFNFIIHNGDSTREPSGWSGANGDQQQLWTVADGAELWKLAGDTTNYPRNPLATAAADINTVRVNYKRFDGRYADWGLHLWPGSGIDVSRLPGLTLDTWGAPVPLSAMPNYVAGDGVVSFDIPVLNPKDDATRRNLSFIIHGLPPNENDKDGRAGDIVVSYAALNPVGGVAPVWLVQQDASVYTAAPDTRIANITEARAHWLSQRLLQWPRVDASGRFKLYHAANGKLVAVRDALVSGADGSVDLSVNASAVPSDLATRFKFVAPGVVLRVADADLDRVAALQASQLVVVQEDATGKVQNASALQIAGAMDDRYATAESLNDLGVSINGGRTGFKLWAPTAQKVSVCTYPNATGAATAITEMVKDPATGAWSASLTGDLTGQTYKYVVEVFVRGVGVVRNLVTDPYSISLTTDSARSWIGNLDADALKPAGWDAHTAPATVASNTDMVIYELHVRDFSVNDATVSAANRGKFTAFTEADSNGMRHLRALAQAGLTDVHLLPVFDIGSVPERNCVNPSVSGSGDSQAPQTTIGAVRDTDCFNWGYDPFHYTAPEGSYATDPSNGATRVLEFRRMVQALHQAGLRVGMDVVYNHTIASGQKDKSVLDRVVPGYYHRLNSTGSVEMSTCCDNTATEHRMMGKLMSDSVLTWAKAYRIDSFRFDLMAHQPRAVMESLRDRLLAETGRVIPLVGEGWNFGEVANGERFVQASQLSLNGSGIATFSDRARDHIRGGSPFDGGTALVRNQGFVNGLFYDDNGSGATPSRTSLMWSADLIKSGLAGSIRGFTMTTHWDAVKRLEELDYNGQPAGYVSSPSEVVNYVENHDNQTLFDINAYKLPVSTSREDRARVQMLAAAINAFSQGVTYFHAGIDTLRSKSMDRNSYNSGDWFNRLDWSYQSNHFGTGLPPQGDNGDNWSVMRPLLTNTAIAPTATEIAWARDQFRDLLKIRASTTLLRLPTAAEIQARLRFRNTGSTQEPTVLVGQLDGTGLAGANHAELIYFINVDKVAHGLTLDGESGKAWTLHPVHRAVNAADRRAANDARYDSATGQFTIPPRTAVVWVR